MEQDRLFLETSYFMSILSEEVRGILQLRRLTAEFVKRNTRKREEIDKRVLTVHCVSRADTSHMEDVTYEEVLNRAEEDKSVWFTHIRYAWTGKKNETPTYQESPLYFVDWSREQ